MMKLEALRVFAAVVEAGNIKDAAARACRTSSAVSMTLKQLERDVGGPLFETDYKDKPTALGRFVFETATRQIESYDKAIRQIREFADNKIGRLALASVPSAASNLVPGFLSRFIEDRPGVSLELFDLDTRNVRVFVETGQANIGISGRPSNTTKVAFEPIFKDSFQLVCSTQNPLCLEARPIRWKDIARQTLIRNGASDKMSAAQYAQLAANSSLQVSNVASLLGLAKAGVGVTLLPAMATIDLPDGVTGLAFEGGSIRRTVGLVTRKGASLDPVTAAFRQTVYEMIPDLAAQFGFEAEIQGMS